MECKTLIYSGHALRRMFERNISPAGVRATVVDNEIIETYPHGIPHPSMLVLGFIDGQPLHIVLGYNDTALECYVITAYRPDPGQWNANFNTRRTV